MTKLEDRAKKFGFTVEQKPKGSATIVFGGKRLAEMVCKRKLDGQR